MAKLPTDTRLKVEKAIEGEKVLQEKRPYLGISIIADSCPRKLWYGFRLVADRYVTARQDRLFTRGHREEPVIQEDLRKIGVICHSDQTEVVTGNGHIKGHIDDLLDNIPDAPKTTHLGEYKTHNDKSFKDILKNGLSKSKPMHYGQMICYMRLLKLTRGLYVAVNKNDDSRYYERVYENKEKADELLKRGFDIISTEIPPQKIGSATWFECKWCDYYQICHFGEPVLKNCRTCHFCDICDGGVWECSKFGIELAFEQQIKGCPNHVLMEGLR